MSLKEKITEDMKAAMRAKDPPRLSAIRMLQAAIQRREVDERITLDDTQVLQVVEKLIKQGRESVSQYEKGGRADLVAKEQADIAVFENYLPAQMSDDEIAEVVAAAIAEAGAGSIKDMGKVMAVIRPKVQGRADMGAVSAKVKASLQS